jgi:hypothetical protein
LPQTSSNSFKIIQTIPKRYYAVGRPNSLLLSGRPTRARARAHALPVPLTGRPRLLETPPPVTVPAHMSGVSVPLCLRPNVRVRRTLPARAVRGLLSAPPAGRDRTPRAPAHRVAPPRSGPPLPSPFSPPGRAAVERIPPRAAPSKTRFFTPLRPLSRVLEPPRHSPHPDHRLRPPEPASPSRILADLRRRPPLPGELIPSFQSPGFLAFSSPPRLSRAAGPQPRRRPPEPLTADERRRPETSPPPLCRPVVRVSATSAPPARRHPGAPVVLSGESCRRLTAVGPTAVPPSRCPDRARAATARPRPSRACWPTRGTGRPPHGLDPEVGFRPSTVRGFLNCFPFVLNNRN